MQPLTNKLLTSFGLFCFGFFLFLFRFFDQIQNFFTAVKTARRADSVSFLRRLTIVALGESNTLKRMMRAPVLRMGFCAPHSYNHNGFILSFHGFKVNILLKTLVTILFVGIFIYPK